MTKAVLVACLESAGAAANQAAHTPYEYGYRVPLLVISPFVKSPQGVQGRGLIDSTVRSDAAILDFIEKTFSVPGGEGALGTLDQIGTKQTKSDDLRAMIGTSLNPYITKPSSLITTDGFNGTLPNCGQQTMPSEPSD